MRARYLQGLTVAPWRAVAAGGQGAGEQVLATAPKLPCVDRVEIGCLRDRLECGCRLLL